MEGGGKKCSLSGYIGKIKVNLRFEDVKILMIVEALLLEAIP